jgi:murein DD-endopeptidase MepM/ murein hydrolase activator NlpD
VGKLAGVLLTTLGVSVVAGAIYVGYYFGYHESTPDSMMASLRKTLSDQRHELDSVSLVTQENMDALAVRLGQLKAHVIRLDALGQRLIEKAELDKGEFDFENVPGVGGPADESSEGGSQTMAVPDFLKALDDLSKQIEHRSLQLGVLETMLMNRDLQDEVYPAGRPVKRGWVSSYYGYRTDPFNGRIAHHDGIDIAGKWGADVVAVASGVVTWAGKRYGYGDLVEINHGNGYVTRYGHNQAVRVKVGDTIKKGQVVAAMGSTGRSTGPHVHFEVLLNGRVVDPIKYIRAAKDEEDQG